MKVEECMSIEHVRNEIDKIDFSLIQLLAERAKYVEKASQFKKDQQSVQAPDRVKILLENRKKIAFEYKLSPLFIEKLFKEITTYFINKEKNRWLISNYFKIDDVLIEDVLENDLQSILDLQILSYQREAVISNDYKIPPLLYSINDMQKDVQSKNIYKAVFKNIRVGSVRGYKDKNTGYIEKLIVHQDYQNLGVGKKLMKYIEKQFIDVQRFELFTGTKSNKNIALYKNLGYKIFKDKIVNDNYSLIFMEKIN